MQNSPIKREPKWKLILRKIEFGTPEEACEAAKTLSDCRNRRCKEALIRLMLEHPERWVGEFAAYALAWSDHRGLIRPFVQCLADQSRNEYVRGEAAEALTYHADVREKRSRRGRRIWSRMETALLAGLADPSPTVRFWCCFALGSIGSAKAVEPLRRLRDHDREIAPGWWYVGEEAADALAMIAGHGTDLDRAPIPPGELCPRPPSIG